MESYTCSLVHALVLHCVDDLQSPCFVVLLVLDVDVVFPRHVYFS